MSHTNDVFADVLDAQIRNQAKRGTTVRERAHLKNVETTMAQLDHWGVRIPHREFAPEQAASFPTTTTVSKVVDGDVVETERVNLYQRVHEHTEEFGSFGAAADDDPTHWHTVDLTGDTIRLTVVNEWSRRRTVDKRDFLSTYSPVWTERGTPVRDY